MIPWLQNPRPLRRDELTAPQAAELFAAALALMSTLEKASLLNCLLHRAPRVFALLLQSEPRESAAGGGKS